MEDEKTVRIPIPSEATGQIIGKDGWHIRQLGQIEGISQARLQKSGSLNSRVLIVRGTNEAIRIVQRDFEIILQETRRQLTNTSRQDHSWTLTRKERLLTPHITHRTGKSEPKFVQANAKGNWHAAKR